MQLHHNLQALMDSVAASRRRRIFFIMGVPGSGCRRVARALDAHPDICCMQNGHFADSLERRLREGLARYNAEIPKQGNWSRHRKERTDSIEPKKFTYNRNDMDRLVTEATHLILARAAGGDPLLVGDHTPENINHFSSLAHLFPTARFVQVIRDVRDVVVAAWLSSAGILTENITAGPETAEHAGNISRSWFREITKTRAIAARIEDRYMEVRYEHLWSDPDKAVGQVLEFLGSGAADVSHLDRRIEPGHDTLYFDAGETSTGDQSYMPGVWKNRLDATAQSQIKAACGALMAELGYE